MGKGVGGELERASDEWQKVERRMSTATAESLRGWIAQNDWIVSAIYVPDGDPTTSIYVNEPVSGRHLGTRLTREFFTPTGTVRFTFAAGPLLDHTGRAMHKPFLQPRLRIRQQ